IDPPGWEDYDFWCCCVERGFWGAPAGTVLAEYRVHDGSMLHTATDLPAKKLEVIAEMERRHPWLSIPRPICVIGSEPFANCDNAATRLA
ncbi:MAG: hypothetical protein ACREF3_08055, partial [Acetobacteraceae bacterium]